MKVVTYHLGDNEIEFHNSLLGKEEVFVNGELKSSISSFWGAKHTLPIVMEGKDVDFEMQVGFGRLGLVCDVSVGGQPLVMNHKPKTLKSLFLIGFVVGIIGGILLAID